MKWETKKPWLTTIIFLVIAVALVGYLGSVFYSQRTEEPIYPGKGVTEIRMLSDWAPYLKDTVVDTEVYVIKGEEDGGKMLVMGGTHPREPSAMVTAITMIENATAQQGTMYIIPRLNKSAYTYTEPQEAMPMRITIDTPGGERWFRVSGREINPIHQWPDPEVYAHPSGLMKLSGKECRNINRVYPGNPDGNLAEKIAAAVIDFINSEEIDIAFDMHEGDAMYQSINSMVAHQNAMDIASGAVFNMSFDGIEIALQESAPNMRGFFHREIGDACPNTKAVLAETLNPEMGRIQGPKTEALIVEGKDKYGELAARSGLFIAKFTENGSPLSERVARHIETARQLVEASNSIGDKPQMKFTMPTYNDIMTNGLGVYLNPAD